MADGTNEVRLYDTDGNPSQMADIESHSYSLDSAYRITGITNASNSALSWTYGYDVLDRLNSASQGATSLGWTYDANGNRLTQSASISTSYTISASNNRLTNSSVAQSRSYTYDADSNVLTYGTNTFTYNKRDRMATAKVGSVTTSYVYNALGQRIEKSGGPAGTVLFLYDQAGHLQGEYTSTGALIEETVYMGDIPVATYNLRFPGQYYDQETGLTYNGFRDYDSSTGRYIESDLIGLQGGINTYSYGGANPISHYDALGLDCTAVGLTVTCTPPGGPTISFPRPQVGRII